MRGALSSVSRIVGQRVIADTVAVVLMAVLDEGVFAGSVEPLDDADLAVRAVWGEGVLEGGLHGGP